MSDAKRKNQPSDPTTNYAKRVVAGRIIAGPHVRNQCQRHLDDLKRKDLWFDVTAAARVMRFFENVLVLSDGQFDGLPFVLHPSQQFIVGSMFGWKVKPGGKKSVDKEEWFRRFRRAYIQQGKGNGKTPMIAGMGLYGMIADGEASAEIYSAAATKAQAAISFNDAVKMVRKSPHLDRILTVSGVNPAWQLSHVPSQSKFLPVSKESKRTGSGPRPSFVLADEVHEHPDKGIIEMLERGFKFRRQPMLIMATNAGHDLNSVCGEEYQHAVRVAARDVEDDDTFTYVCEHDKGEKPLTQSRVWPKSNPTLGTIITRDYLKRMAKDAKALPSRQNNILRLHFCEWTTSHTAWISRDKWTAIEDPKMKESDFIGRALWGGLDLSATTDMTALARVYEDGVDDEGRRKFAAFVDAWMPEAEMLERIESDRMPYDVWKREGWLHFTEGARIQMEEIAAHCIREHAQKNYRMIAYDRYLYNNFEDEVSRAGGSLPMIEHAQSTSKRKSTPLWMPESIDVLETLIKEKRLRVQPSPVLRAAVAGAHLYQAALLRRWQKHKSTARIDSLVALTMAVGVANMVDKPTLADQYEAGEHEVIVL